MHFDCAAIRAHLECDPAKRPLDKAESPIPFVVKIPDRSRGW